MTRGLTRASCRRPQEGVREKLSFRFEEREGDADTPGATEGVATDVLTTGSTSRSHLLTELALKDKPASKPRLWHDKGRGVLAGEVKLRKKAKARQLILDRRLVCLCSCSVGRQGKHEVQPRTASSVDSL